MCFKGGKERGFMGLGRVGERYNYYKWEVSRNRGSV